MNLIFWPTIFTFGILSMGFQLLAARMLGPWFGSSIVVWAFLISTFLLAFAVGSFVGGRLATTFNKHHRRFLLGVIILGVLTLIINVAARREILAWCSDSFSGISGGLLCACAILFFLPVFAMSCMSPLAVEWVVQNSDGKVKPGTAAGRVFGTSTAGNIAGVMSTALVLIPNFGISTLLNVWLVVTITVYVCFWKLLQCLEMS